MSTITLRVASQPKAGRPRVARTFLMSEEVVARMKAAAHLDLRSMNSAVEMACREWLERQNAKGRHVAAQ